MQPIPVSLLMQVCLYAWVQMVMPLSVSMGIWMKCASGILYAPWPISAMICVIN
ncbi:hypothetical protein D3C72_2223110 [compost metagenome]